MGVCNITLELTVDLQHLIGVELNICVIKITAYASAKKKVILM